LTPRNPIRSSFFCGHPRVRTPRFTLSHFTLHTVRVCVCDHVLLPTTHPCTNPHIHKRRHTHIDRHTYILAGCSAAPPAPPHPPCWPPCLPPFLLLLLLTAPTWTLPDRGGGRRRRPSARGAAGSCRSAQPGTAPSRPGVWFGVVWCGWLVGWLVGGGVCVLVSGRGGRREDGGWMGGAASRFLSFFVCLFVWLLVGWFLCCG
jgi:hypothetical protein